MENTEEKWGVLSGWIAALNSGDDSSRQQADRCLTQLQNSPTACAELFAMLSQQLAAGRVASSDDAYVIFFVLGAWQAAARSGAWDVRTTPEVSRAIRVWLSGVVSAPQAVPGLRLVNMNKVIDTMACIAVMGEWPARWPELLPGARSLLSSGDAPAAARGARLLRAVCEEVRHNGARVPLALQTAQQAALREAAGPCLRELLVRAAGDEAGVAAAAAFLAFAEEEALGEALLGMAEAVQACPRGPEAAMAAHLPICCEVFEFATIRPGSAAEKLFHQCVGFALVAVQSGGVDDTVVLPVVLTLFEKHLGRLLGSQERDAVPALLADVHNRMVESEDEDTLETCVSIWDAVAERVEMLADQGASLRQTAESTDAEVVFFKPLLLHFLGVVVPAHDARCIPADVVAMDDAVRAVQEEAWYTGLQGRFILAASKVCGLYCETVMFAPDSVLRRALAASAQQCNVRALDVLFQLCAAVAPELLSQRARAFPFTEEVVAGVCRTLAENYASALVARGFGAVGALAGVVRKMPEETRARLLGSACEVAVAAAKDAQAHKDVVRQAGHMLSTYAAGSCTAQLGATPCFGEVFLVLETVAGQGKLSLAWAGYFEAAVKVLLAGDQSGPLAAVLGCLVLGGSAVGMSIAADVVQNACDEPPAKKALLWGASKGHVEAVCCGLDSAACSVEDAQAVVSFLAVLFRVLHKEVGQGFASEVVSLLLRAAKAGGAVAGSQEYLAAVFDVVEVLVRPRGSPHVGDSVQLCAALHAAAAAHAESFAAYARLVRTVLESHGRRIDATASHQLVGYAFEPLLAAEADPSTVFETLCWAVQMQKSDGLLASLSLEKKRELALCVLRMRFASDMYREGLVEVLLMLSTPGHAAFSGANPPHSGFACEMVKHYVATTVPQPSQLLLTLVGELEAQKTYPLSGFDAAMQALRSALSPS